jgi:lipopolysaccharide transport system ATP-binding protein
MSFDTNQLAISLHQVGKVYRRFRQPADRFWQALWPGLRAQSQDFVALAPMDLEVFKGEALGIVGRNGAGKSTLLQLICGTLTPSSGTVAVHGKVGALLELGAGFNPDFSGRENVFLAASVMGLTQREIAALYDSIVAFSGIGDFIEQPVKTYSSGMYVRLAFSVATSVSPDILVVDEALSVGDGAFARQSFERIMKLRESGTTVLFCSHSLYQVEAFCSRAIWLDHGQVRLVGSAASVVAAYNDSLRAKDASPASASADVSADPSINADVPVLAMADGNARITRVLTCVDGVCGRELMAKSGESDVTITVEFCCAPGMPIPVVATGFILPDGQIFSSVYTLFDHVEMSVDASGVGAATVTFPRIALLKGRFTVGAYLFCERAIHVYDRVLEAAVIDVTQPGVEQGFVHLTHHWDGATV